ncbi:MAG: hypothetical protein QF437_24865, partial [Planctomycetota bacterium]|nr:hypothetical protein [Planctomycetota bacterium]
ASIASPEFSPRRETASGKIGSMGSGVKVIGTLESWSVGLLDGDLERYNREDVSIFQLRFSSQQGKAIT